MVGLYKRRKNNTTDAALDFALPTTNTAGGLQQAQVTAMQDEIHVLKKQLNEVSPFAHLYCEVQFLCMVDACVRTGGIYIRCKAVVQLCTRSKTRFCVMSPWLFNTFIHSFILQWMFLQYWRSSLVQYVIKGTKNRLYSDK